MSIFDVKPNKGKPVERRGRKASGLRALPVRDGYDSGAARKYASALDADAQRLVRNPQGDLLTKEHGVEMKRIPVQLLLTILIACLATSTTWSSPLVDEPAPDFALHGIDGKTLRLSEYRSEIVLLSFASDSCARCRQALPFFEELNRQYQGAGLNVIGVNIEGNAKVATDLAAELGLNFPILLDTGQSVSRLYDLNQLPLTLLIDREGVVQLINQGFRGDSGAQISAGLARLLAD